jgi:peptidoglycan/xylan/chitin deacetylase (PgdA/CDA1 family)
MTSHRLTYQHRRRGLDHDWFAHEPTHTRARLSWPGGKRVALWITVPVEYFPLDAPAQPVRPLGGLDRGYPDFWSFSNRDYGARIGVYRLMRVLDKLGLRATAAVNAAAVTQYPRAIDEILQRGWEIAAHGIDMGKVHHGQLSQDEERDRIRLSREALENVTTQPIAGWYSPGHSQSANTLPLLAEAGFDYVTDWANDDLPYMMKTATGSLCALPLTYELSDRLLLVQHNLTVEDYETQVLEAYLRLDAEAALQEGGRILSLSVSPWILGYPHRIGTLERLLERILDAGSLWPATGMEIAKQFKMQAPGMGLAGAPTPNQTVAS